MPISVALGKQWGRSQAWGREQGWGWVSSAAGLGKGAPVAMSDKPHPRKGGLDATRGDTESGMGAPILPNAVLSSVSLHSPLTQPTQCSSLHRS